MSRSAQCGDKLCTTFQSLQRVLQVYAPCAGAKRGFTQWVGDSSQEDKLDWYCILYTAGFIYMLRYLLTKLLRSV